MYTNIMCMCYILTVDHISVTHNMQAGVTEQIAKLDKLILELKQQESSHLELLSAILVKRNNFAHKNSTVVMCAFTGWERGGRS